MKSLSHRAIPPPAGSGSVRHSGKASANARTNVRNVPWRALALFGIVMLTAVAFFMFGPTHKRPIRIDELARQERWEDLLKAARNLPHPTAADQLQVNRALYHCNRLVHDFFSIPRNRADSMLPGPKASLEACLALSETLLELGQVNMAEHYGQEALELTGPQPANLRLLARVYLVKGQPDAASVFLGRLSKIPSEAVWAEHQLDQIREAKPFAGDTELARIADLCPRSDEPYVDVDPEAVLNQLLTANATNRMALEYLMAHYLLTRNLAMITKHASALKVLGYQELPECCEQAIVLYQQVGPGESARMELPQVSQRTRERFQQLTTLIKQAGGNPASIRAMLETQFGETFWFYYFFGYCPGQRSHS